MRTPRSGQWTTSWASLAAVGLVALATCVVAGASAAGAQPFTTPVTGSCTLPQGGTAPLTADVTVPFPESAQVGQPMRATGIAVSITLSPQLTDGLRAAGGTDVGIGVDTALAAADGGPAQNVTVPHLAAAATALPADGPMTAAVNGQVPALTPERPGTLGISVASLAPTLAVTTPTGPVTVACTMDTEQAGDVATVPVNAGPRPHAVQPAASGIVVSYRIAGRSTLRKLGSAVTLQGQFDATVDAITGTITGTITLRPSVGTFLSFGFVPVTATTTFTEQGQATGTFVNGVADVTSKLVLGLSQASVNGTPLQVGNACRTAQPAIVRITGPLNLSGSSDFTSFFTVPRFRGCGVTEDLDPLFDGLVSGQNNELDVTLTLRCSADACTTGN